MIIRFRKKNEGKNRHRDTTITARAGRLSCLIESYSCISHNSSQDYLGGCIILYDDTLTKFFPRRYVLIRAFDDEGQLDDACWSMLGSITEDTGLDYQVWKTLVSRLVALFSFKTRSANQFIAIRMSLYKDNST